MARWVEQSWEPGDETHLPRRDRRAGRYAAYLPDPLAGRPLTLSPDLARRAAVAERAVRALSTGPGSADLEGLSRFLLRSEAIASSLIEGIAPSPASVAVAELAQQEGVHGVSEQAKLVANNITVVRRATEELVVADVVSVDDIVRLQAALLTEARHHGLRLVQNWIGGSNWHPLDAVFVPPPPGAVDALMSDLVDHLNGAAHAPLVQAAVVHAQFETVHPFTDGNGRVGRALVHTVLARRGLTRASVLPVSLVLSTLRDTYVEGLTDYRYDGPWDSPAAQQGLERWLGVFLDATLVAVEQAGRLVQAVSELRVEWERALSEHRASLGVREVPRAGSATARLLAALPEAPVVTARTVERMLGVSFSAAKVAADELADAGILHRRQLERGTTGYIATEVLDLIGHAERQLASTRFDTRTGPPNRPVPARPV